MSKIRKKWPFFVIGVSVETAEYSVPNIRLVLAEYSAEDSVFGRSLHWNIHTHVQFVKVAMILLPIIRTFSNFITDISSKTF